jgi:hypothetical protein
MPKEEHEGERVASLSLDHNVEGMEVAGMVQNANKIMEELAALFESIYITTLALGSRPRQGVARLWAKWETQKSHHMLLGVQRT